MTDKLPELPPYMYGREVEKNERVWSEQCMRRFAEEAVRLEREACAIMCEVHAAAIIKDGKQPAWAIAHECAAAIRARSSQV